MQEVWADTVKRILVTGDRKWNDRSIIGIVIAGFATLDDLIIVEGCAEGADECAESVNGTNIEHEHYPAHWRHVPSCPDGCREVVGRAAGPIRNRKMLAEAQPDIVLAFHDDLSQSRGTKDMVKIAKAAKIPVYLISHP